MSPDVQAIGLPFNEAIDFFRQKANVKTARWTDVWRDAHSRSFMVAGAATDSLVQDFRDAVDKAIAKGTTLAEFRADFDAIVKKHGWEYNGSPGWRSRVIYETNLSTAYSAGRYAQLTDPDVQAAYPYWQYVHSGSQHPRLQHLAWDGLTLRCDDGFWDTHFPPNGWRCGCRVRPVSGPGLARMGKDGPDRAPPIEYRAWVDKKTGRAHQVPVGIDPGFDYNPGKAWKTAPVKSEPLKELPGTGTPRHAAASFPLPDLPPDLARFLNAPEGNVAVGRAAERVSHHLATAGREVNLSAATIAKQRARHARDVQDTDYAVLDELLANPTVILRQNDATLMLLLRRSGNVYAAAVKATKARHEMYVVSFYKPRLKSIEQLLRAHELVSGDADNLKP